MLASLLVVEVFSSVQINSQTALVDPRKTEYVCVLDRAIDFTIDQKIEGLNTVKANGTVVVLPCEAANIRQDRLIDADYIVLERMQLARVYFGTLRTGPPGSEVELRVRAEFQKLAKQVCVRHPKIVLLSLDWKSEKPTSQEGGVALKVCSAF